MDFFTLHTLAAEWDPTLRGATLMDAWTQSPGELSLAFAAADGAESTVRVHCEGALPLLFRTGGHGRARRNTAVVFEEAHGRTVARVRTAERDRFVFFDFEEGGAVQLRLFGPQPNAFLVDGEGRVTEAFLSDAEWRGEPAPVPSPAPAVRDVRGVRRAVAGEPKKRSRRPSPRPSRSSTAPSPPRPPAAPASTRTRRRTSESRSSGGCSTRPTR